MKAAALLLVFLASQASGSSNTTGSADCGCHPCKEITHGPHMGTYYRVEDAWRGRCGSACLYRKIVDDTMYCMCEPGDLEVEICKKLERYAICEDGWDGWARKPCSLVLLGTPLVSCSTAARKLFDSCDRLGLIAPVQHLEVIYDGASLKPGATLAMADTEDEPILRLKVAKETAAKGAPAPAVVTVAELEAAEAAAKRKVEDLEWEEKEAKTAADNAMFMGLETRQLRSAATAVSEAKLRAMDAVLAAEKATAKAEAVLEAEGTAYYTVVMADLDVPQLHWIKTDMLGSRLQAGGELLPYRGPRTWDPRAPVPGPLGHGAGGNRRHSGPHLYALVAWQQNRRNRAADPARAWAWRRRLTAMAATRVLGLTTLVRVFGAVLELGDPVAANFYYAENK